MQIKPGTLIALFLSMLFSSMASAASQQEQEAQAATAAYQACDLADTGVEVAHNLAECERLAELGHRHAQFQMGNFCYEGVALEQDYACAAHWYTQASSQGHAQAQLQLGMMYASGQGVAVNKAQAFIILKMSAINGSDLAYDQADRILLEMNSQELDIANRVLAKIFLRFVQSIQQNSQTTFDLQSYLG